MVYPDLRLFVTESLGLDERPDAERKVTLEGAKVCDVFNEVVAVHSSITHSTEIAHLPWCAIKTSNWWAEHPVRSAWAVKGDEDLGHFLGHGSGSFYHRFFGGPQSSQVVHPLIPEF